MIPVLFLKWQTAVIPSNQRRLSIDVSPRHGIPIREGIHRSQPDVEAPVVRGIHDQDVDSVAAVPKLVARPAHGRVPRRALKAPDGREPGDLALRVPLVPGDEAVGSVRARNAVHRPRSVIVAGVVRYCDGDRHELAAHRLGGYYINLQLRTICGYG